MARVVFFHSESGCGDVRVGTGNQAELETVGAQFGLLLQAFLERVAQKIVLFGRHGDRNPVLTKQRAQPAQRGKFDLPGILATEAVVAHFFEVAVFVFRPGRQATVTFRGALVLHHFEQGVPARPALRLFSRHRVCRNVLVGNAGGFKHQPSGYIGVVRYHHCIATGLRCDTLLIQVVP